MFKHLEYTNEDTVRYKWSDVKVCIMTAEGKINWDDSYTTKFMCLTLSKCGQGAKGGGLHQV